VDDSFDSTMRRLGIPESVQGLLRRGARAAIEKGAESLLDAAMDGAELNSEQQEALRAAIRALMETEAF
jgi:hypothetical protein